MESDVINWMGHSTIRCLYWIGAGGDKDPIWLWESPSDIPALFITHIFLPEYWGINLNKSARWSLVYNML